MRFLLLTFLSVLVVSCGQGGSSSSKSNNPTQQNEEAISTVRTTDLLDVAMDVSVEISGSKITFKQSANNSLSGVRTTCSVAVSSGESYDYSLNGSSLVLSTPSGERMNLSRVSGSNDSIVGSWKGEARNGEQLILRRVTFVSENRLVMRTHCEG